MPDPDPTPPTTKALEAKIAELEKRLAAGDGLEARVVLAMEMKIKDLEARLAAAKKEEPPPAPKKKSLLDHLDPLGDLFK